MPLKRPETTYPALEVLISASNNSMSDVDSKTAFKVNAVPLESKRAANTALLPFTNGASLVLPKYIVSS